MPDESSQIKGISGIKVIYPIIIGFAVIGYMLFKEFDIHIFNLLHFTYYTLIFLAFAFLMMITRDLGYMIRIKILSDNKLNWMQCFRIVFLWEFASAITPSAVGGTAVATLFIYKEGINLGKSTAIVLATAFLDELYFLIMFPLLFLIVGTTSLFTIGGEMFSQGVPMFDNKYFYFAVVGYSIKLIFDLFVAYGLFINPNSIKQLIIWLFKLPILKRWHSEAEKTGNDLVIASVELKNKSFKFWAKAFTATFFSWTARYWVVNFLIVALIFGLPDINSDMILSTWDHILIFARQLVMWIMMLVMPSPGGSGFAEAVFSDYLGEFIPVGFVAIMALLWRFVSYYPYLFVGAFILPRWTKKHFTAFIVKKDNAES